MKKFKKIFLESGSTDTIFPLALIHHLAISNNSPLPKNVEVFKKNCNSLIFEFISKSDFMVQKFLSTRKNIFDQYTQGFFENELATFFNVIKSETIKPLSTTLYLMKKNSHAQ